MAKQTLNCVSDSDELVSPKQSDVENGENVNDLDRVLVECSSQAQAIKRDIRCAIEEKLTTKENVEQSDDMSNVSSESQLLFENAIKTKIDGLETALKSLNVVQMYASDSETQCSVKDENWSESQSDSMNIDETKERRNETGSLVNASTKPVPLIEAADNNCIPNISETHNSVEKLEVNVKSAKIKKSKMKQSVRKNVREMLTVETLMKTLSSSNNDSENLDIVCKKYVDLFNDHRTLEANSKQHEKICLQLMKEKEQLQSEHNRVVLAKSKLESLCRELQKHSRTVKEETLLRIKQEEEKHRKVANKFQETLIDIMSLIKDNQHRSESLREENRDLANKMKALMDHYDKWEKNIDKIMRQKELETQIMNAKLAKSALLQNEEKKLFVNEKEALINMVSDLQKRCNESSTNEMHLRAELALYTSKYDEFQTVLAKSNEMFTSFKKDMERMAKQIKKLERETIQWKNKWESCNRALVTLADEKQKRDNDYFHSLQKIQTLEKLCRAMQEERIQMQSKLKQVDQQLQPNCDTPPATIAT